MCIRDSGCTVKIGNDAATADENGVYSLVTKSANTTVTVSYTHLNYGEKIAFRKECFYNGNQN